MRMLLSRVIDAVAGAFETLSAAQEAAAMVEAHRRPSPEVLRRLGIRNQDFTVRL